MLAPPLTPFQCEKDKFIISSGITVWELSTLLKLGKRLAHDARHQVSCSMLRADPIQLPIHVKDAELFMCLS